MAAACEFCGCDDDDDDDTDDALSSTHTDIIIILVLQFILTGQLNQQTSASQSFTPVSVAQWANTLSEPQYLLGLTS